MRIVIVSQHFPPENSGNASRVSDMAEKLAGLGDDVTVLAPFPTFPTGTFRRTWKWRKRSEWRGTKLLNLWAWQPQAQDPGFLSRIAYYLTFALHATLWAIFNARKYDVIVGSTPPVFTALPGLVARTFGKRFVVEVRDLWIDAAVSLGFVREDSLSTKLSRRFELRAYRKAHLIAVTTEDVAAKVRARSGTEAPIVVVPNGVDTSRFKPVPAAKKAQFVYAGNIGHAQDFDTIIQALAIVRRTVPDTQIVLAGSGDITEATRELAARHGLKEAVHFPGILPRDDVPRLYSESIAGLAPLKPLATLEYAIPTKAYEAMACGVPFLGTGLGEIQKLAEMSGAGIVAPNRPEEVAKRMLQLLGSPDEARAMGERGRMFVEKNFDRGHIAREYRRKIAEVVERG